MRWTDGDSKEVTGPNAPIAWKLGTKVLIYLPTSKELWVGQSKTGLRKLTKIIDSGRKPHMREYPDGGRRWRVTVGRRMTAENYDLSATKLNGKRLTRIQFQKKLGAIFVSPPKR